MKKFPKHLVYIFLVAAVLIGRILADSRMSLASGAKAGNTNGSPFY